jgi:hypothetical protein
MTESNRRFYMLPCWIFRIDGQRFCIASNDRVGAQVAAERQWVQEHGRSPLSIELKGIA